MLKVASEGADDLLIILGSAYQAPTCQNPFSWEERAQMISASLDSGMALGTKEHPVGLYFRPVRDNRSDNEEWRTAVIKTVESFCASHYGDQAVTIVLNGVSKPGDASTWYLQYFPMWQYRAIDPESIPPLNATEVRANLFSGLDTWKEQVPAPVQDYLTRWIHTEEGTRLTKEYHAEQREKQRAAAYSDPLTYTTSDAVVYHAGKVLVVRRTGELGNGLWALPGGFIGAKSETCYQAAKRVAGSETGIELQDAWCCTKERGGLVFDAP